VGSDFAGTINNAGKRNAHVTSPISSAADFEHMFELAPVSLWLEDYSALKHLFDAWRAEG
jgi:hypothetical protein